MAIRKHTLAVLVSITILHYYFLGSSWKNPIQSTQKQEDPFVSSLSSLPVFVKTAGRPSTHWQVWNRSHVLHSDKGWKCRWTKFKTPDLQHQSPMCVHQGRDIISGHIRRHGSWYDCNELSSLYQENTKTNPLYIEIGANIGACLMQMLLTTNATIVAVEPHPKNQFCLTSTLLRMKPHYRDRVFFFPLGLGNTQGASVIRGALGNMGNSIVGGNTVQDGYHQAFLEEMPIAVERLDHLLDSTQFTLHKDSSSSLYTIPLVKMDAQGYECYIVEGMAQLLNSIAIIKTELEQQFLSAFDGCSDERLVQQLRTAGFDIYRKGQIMKTLPARKGPVDIVARRPNPNTDANIIQ